MQGKVIRGNSIQDTHTGRIFILRLRRLGRRRFIVSIVCHYSDHHPIFRERIYTSLPEAHAKYIKVELNAYARQNKT